jgi:hypothetical protein
MLNIEQIIFVMECYKPDINAYNSDTEYQGAIQNWWFILNCMVDQLRLNDAEFDADKFISLCNSD